METASHVPAWKKLGLKLKYAKEEDYSTYTNGVTGTGTGTGDLDEGVNGVGNKGEQVNGKGKKRRFEDGEEDDSKHSTKKNKKEKREKKRVSFSADTKERDGDADGDESDRGDGGISVSGPDSPSNGENRENESNTNDPATQSTEKKDKKKKKGKKDTASFSTHIHETPILSYLSQYHTNRATWKFHKNRETQLFKHILSLEHVPSRYNAALLAYLRGLKSDGAKERLFQTAEGVVKGDIEGRSEDGKDGTTTEMKKGNEDENGKPDTKSYDNAVEAFRTWLLDPKDDLDSTNLSEGLDDDIRKQLETRQRAELVIFAVQDKLFSLEKPKPTPQTKDNGKAKKVPASKKKKKNRTAIVEISSSSESESSSDSDSDSDSSSSGSSSS